MPSNSSTARRATAKPGKASDDARKRRTQALEGVRRELLMDAARSAFAELGMERTSIREIAKRAGYTPGAIYSYFTSKEEIYGALLAESLDRLNDAVRREVPNGLKDVDELRASATAFFEFYLRNPRDLDLGFYLFQGMKPRGLTRELNEKLNARLRSSLQPTQDAMERLGVPAGKALREVTSLFAHAVGVLVLTHTGRIRMFKQDSHALFDAYLDQVVIRVAAARN